MTALSTRFDYGEFRPRWFLSRRGQAARIKKAPREQCSEAGQVLRPWEDRTYGELNETYLRTP
jgi:hypothetical protein